MNLKKIGKLFTSKSVWTSSHEILQPNGHARNDAYYAARCKIYTSQVSVQKLSHSGSVGAHPATAKSLDADCNATFHEFCSVLLKQLVQKKAWPLLLTSFKTRQGRKSFSTSWDHSPTFPSTRANHFVSAESMVLRRTGKKKNGADSHFG